MRPASSQQHVPLAAFKDGSLFDIPETCGFIFALLDPLFSLLLETTAKYPDQPIPLSRAPFSEAIIVGKIN